MYGIINYNYRLFYHRREVMKTAVTYYSKTGHTKKIAEAIAQAAGCGAVTIADISVDTVDMLFIGGSIYGGALDPSLVLFIGGLDAKKIKRAAVFSTYIKEPKALGLMKDILSKQGIPVKDEFSCKGQFLFMNRKHPDSADLEEAKKFAASVIGK
jgi:flavodoxin